MNKELGKIRDLFRERARQLREMADRDRLHGYSKDNEEALERARFLEKIVDAIYF